MSKITKHWISEHLDMVVGVLQVLDDLTGGAGLIHEADVVGRITSVAVRSLVDDAPPTTRAEVDARIAALHEKLAEHDRAADADLHAKFDHTNGGGK